MEGSQDPNDMSMNGSPGMGRSNLNYSQDEIEERKKSLADVKKKRKE